MKFSDKRLLLQVFILIAFCTRFTNSYSQNLQPKEIIEIKKDFKGNSYFQISKHQFSLMESDLILPNIYWEASLNEYLVSQRGQTDCVLPLPLVLDSCYFIGNELAFVSSTGKVFESFRCPGLSFRNSHFEVPNTSFSDLNMLDAKDISAVKDNIMAGYLTFEKSIFKQNLQVNGLSGNLHVVNNIFASNTGVSIVKSNASVIVSSNKIKTPITLYTEGNINFRVKNSHLTFNDPDARAIEEYPIQHNLKLISFGDHFKEIRLFNHGKSANNYQFVGAYLQRSTYNFLSSSIAATHTNLFFRESSFEQSTAMNLNNIDSLSFTDCKIDSTLNLNISGGTKHLVILFDNSDVSHINFEFYGHMILGFPGHWTPDRCLAQFSSLLEKFKKEGKLNSYMHLDIQYKNFNYLQRGWIGKILSFVDWTWWNYGYNKGRIIYITIFAVLLFLCINAIISKSLLDFYPLFNNQPLTEGSKMRKLINHSVRIFILTLYIFFSLRVELSQIDMRRTRMTIYFFLQYFFGLICLLFLFGAIIKF
jgi:hypothetical protein